jgi:hypothetical protein
VEEQIGRRPPLNLLDRLLPDPSPGKPRDGSLSPVPASRS